jgi:hypothetical protein
LIGKKTRGGDRSITISQCPSAEILPELHIRIMQLELLSGNARVALA